MTETCFVFFQSNDCDIDGAVKILENYKFKVERSKESISASRNGLTFTVILDKELHVKVEATEIGTGSEYFEKMSKCDARFEIQIENFEEALDEINTLMEIQGAIQDASKGYLFLQWNEELSEPWVD